MKKILFFLILSAILFSCGDDDSSSADFNNDRDYFPLTEGTWYEYRLDSTIYDDFDNSVTLKQWDLRVEIADTITDSEGDDVIRVIRSQRLRNSGDDFQIETVWFLKESNNRLETVEENLRFIKLLFPVQQGITWAGNTFIQPEGNDNPNTSTQFYENWDYQYLSVDQPMTVNGQSFEEVAHISQVDEVGGPGAINHFVSDEYYARNIGLVKKRMEIVIENCGANNCSEKELPVLQRTQLRKGFILDMEITDYNIVP